jgi:hypothetical protein
MTNGLTAQLTNARVELEGSEPIKLCPAQRSLEAELMGP